MPRTEYVTAAQIVRGKLKVSNPQRWTAAMQEFRDGAVFASIKVPQRVRTPEANKAYWAGHIRPLADATGNDPLLLHQYFKHRYLAQASIVLCNRDGEIVDEQTLDRPTTTTLTPEEFSSYLDQIGAFAMELGVHVGLRP